MVGDPWLTNNQSRGPDGALFVECVIGFEASNEVRKGVGNMGDSIVLLLIDMHNLRFAPRTAGTEVKREHVVPSRGAVREIDPDGGISPFHLPKVRIESRSAK